MTSLERRCLETLSLGPLTAKELCAELQIAAGTVGNLVIGLGIEGLVRVSARRYRGIGNGKGKPTNIYGLSEHGRIVAETLKRLQVPA